MAEASLLSILPNLGIGVVAVLALAYLSLKHSQAQKESQAAYMAALDARADKHEKAMKEREDALRSVEKDMRMELTKISEKSIRAVEENSKVLNRVITHLDKH